MTIAVGEALLTVGTDAGINDIKRAVISNMQDWGKRYPHAGYGGMFRHWLKEKNPKPYGSFGNGSAMRVSAAGWLYESIERTREVAKITASVTHDHPEGIRGQRLQHVRSICQEIVAQKQKLKNILRKSSSMI